MATGYTYPVKDGEVTEAADFLLDVARGFGAFIHQRDSGPGLPVKATVDEFYYRDAESDEREYAEWIALSLEQRRALYDEYVAGLKRREAEYAERDEVIGARYDAMIEKVEAWAAPEIWTEMKAFALKQLHESKEHDTGMADFVSRQPEPFDEWVKGQTEMHAQSLARSKESLAERIVRVQQQNEYTEQLYTSLGLDYDALVQ